MPALPIDFMCYSMFSRLLVMCENKPDEYLFISAASNKYTVRTPTIASRSMIYFLLI